MGKPRVSPIEVLKVDGEGMLETDDLLVIEEPLEIRLGFGPEHNRQQRRLAVTMRTPGHDLELAAGFLYAEGIISHLRDLASLKPCEQVDHVEELGNVVRAELVPGLDFDFRNLERNFFTNSSCGVCGKASLEAVKAMHCPRIPQGAFLIDQAVVNQLPKQLRKAQAVFDHTGGLHAAALFDQKGVLLQVKEDIGRHNALDKLIGAAFLNGQLPLQDKMLLLSGRTSFELVQKSLMAGIAVVASVSAPSSLAVQLAETFGMTLIGFLRGERFNLYSHPQRIRLQASAIPKGRKTLHP